MRVHNTYAVVSTTTLKISLDIIVFTKIQLFFNIIMHIIRLYGIREQHAYRSICSGSRGKPTVFRRFSLFLYFYICPTA